MTERSVSSTKAGKMRLENGHWLCTWCSTEIEIGTDAEPVTSLRATAGRPNRHVITVDGRDIHVCGEAPASAPAKV